MSSLSYIFCTSPRLCAGIWFGLAGLLAAVAVNVIMATGNSLGIDSSLGAITILFIIPTLLTGLSGAYSGPKLVEPNRTDRSIAIQGIIIMLRPLLLYMAGWMIYSLTVPVQLWSRGDMLLVLGTLTLIYGTLLMTPLGIFAARLLRAVARE